MLLAGLTGAFEASLEMASLLTYIAIWVPALAAFLTIGLRDGWDGVKAYAQRCVHLSGHWGWYLGVLFRSSVHAIWEVETCSKIQFH